MPLWNLNFSLLIGGEDKLGIAFVNYSLSLYRAYGATPFIKLKFRSQSRMISIFSKSSLFCFF